MGHPYSIQSSSPFGKMFKMKMPREEPDSRSNHCSQKTRKGCNENKNSVGGRASGVRDGKKYDRRESAEKGSENFL